MGGNKRRSKGRGRGRIVVGGNAHGRRQGLDLHTGNGLCGGGGYANEYIF